MGESHEVHFTNEDLTIEVEEDEYILSAAEQAGLDLPYSCRMGTCSVCAAHVDGEVDQSEGMILTDDEKADGYCLLCIAKPRGEVEVDTEDVP
jgi:ferredoxin